MLEEHKIMILSQQYVDFAVIIIYVLTIIKAYIIL